MKKVSEWLIKHNKKIIGFFNILLIVWVTSVFLSALLNLFFEKKQEVAIWKMLTVVWVVNAILVQKHVDKMREITTGALERLSNLLELLKAAGIVQFTDIKPKKVN